MDPFLEVNPRWQALHAWLMRTLAEQALPKAQELGCWIDVERAVYQREPSGEIVLKQDYLVVSELGKSRCILAVVEVLSPANKNGSYVPRYHEKRARFLASRAHFMEIDLLRGGDNPSRQLFPELPPTPYFIFVARKTGVGRNEEGHPLRLQDPLPLIGLPLGPPRPDLPLDLAAAFRAAYDLSIRPRSIRYSEETPPEPPLSKDDAAWVTRMIRAK